MEVTIYTYLGNETDYIDGGYIHEGPRTHYTLEADGNTAWRVIDVESTYISQFDETVLVLPAGTIWPGFGDFGGPHLLMDILPALTGSKPQFNIPSRKPETVNA